RWTDPLDRPRQNGPDSSRRSFTRPNSLSCASVQSLARFIFGEPVSRAPIGVHEPARRFHDFGIAKALITDAADYGQANFLLGNTNGDSQKQGTNAEDHKALNCLHDFS